MPKLGAKSILNLKGVHPVLIDLIEDAILVTDQDFGVTEPQVRDLADQRKKVASGASKTLQSRHLPAVDLSGKSKISYGHAADLVPWNGRAFVWEWPRVYHVAAAMAAAAWRRGVADKVCWGGVWDRWISDYTSPEHCSPISMQVEQQAYNRRHPAPDFPDGPHFQVFKKG